MQLYFGTCCAILLSMKYNIQFSKRRKSSTASFGNLERLARVHLRTLLPLRCDSRSTTVQG